MKTERNKSLIYLTPYRAYSDINEKIHTPFGTVVCYNGDSTLKYTIVKNKEGADFMPCGDFPCLIFCGNIIDGTEKPEMVVHFINYYGGDISIEEVQEAISDFKKTI